MSQIGRIREKVNAQEALIKAQHEKLLILMEEKLVLKEEIEYLRAVVERQKDWLEKFRQDREGRGDA